MKEIKDLFNLKLSDIKTNYDAVFTSKYDQGIPEIKIRCSHLIKNREGKLILLDGYK